MSAHTPGPWVVTDDSEHGCCFESTIEEARTLLSKEHTAGKALGLLRRQAHSFTFVGNV